MELLTQANAVVIAVLANITPDQMHAQTPNDEWDVRDLINHLVLDNTWAAALVSTGNAPRPGGHAIGDRAPLEAYTRSAGEMLAAFAAPGSLSRSVSMPVGPRPVAEFTGFHVIDLMGHAWDLAEATWQNVDLAPELSEEALALARQLLGGLDRARIPFADEVPISANAPAADRLAAYLGKQV
jgi:uncharacterized protein (TIGR03086 family)